MSTVFERNLKLLQKYQPYVFNKLNAYLNGQYKPLNNQVERILIANHGEIIVNMLVISSNNEYLICDHENPIKQSYGWIDRYIDPANKADIVFGIGFGYHLEVLLSSFKNRKVVVIEPNIELFQQILRVRNMETIIEKTEIFLDEAVDAILHRVNELYWDTAKGGIQCEPFEVYGEIFWDLWDELRNKFIKQAENFNVDIATRRQFGELWAHNYIKNLGKITGTADASGLLGKFLGIPGVLVSAGPSLNKNVHLLKELNEKCVIMAAGTAVNILENYGIEPHFMVGIDAGEGEARIHKSVKSERISFIYSNQIATGSIEGYTGPRFLMNYSTDIYTGDFFKKSGINSDIFHSGPTVSNTCFDLLFKMGCNPIILVGQDLAYTDGKLHAGNSIDLIPESKEELASHGYFAVIDIHGNEVYTRSNFISMKNWFEGYFEKVKGRVEIINATEGGLNIEHARNDLLANVIRNYDFPAKPINEIISQGYENNVFRSEIRVKLDAYRSFINSELEKLEKYSREQSRVLDLIKKDVYHPAKNRKAFERALSQLNKLTDLVMDSPIYNSLLKNIIEIDFYLIKAEVDRATSELSSYSDVKNIYVNATEQQNSILKARLELIKGFLARN